MHENTKKLIVLRIEINTHYTYIYECVRSRCIYAICVLSTRRNRSGGDGVCAFVKEKEERL